MIVSMMVSIQLFERIDFGLRGRKVWNQRPVERLRAPLASRVMLDRFGIDQPAAVDDIAMLDVTILASTNPQ